jgi:hypothetical protein
MSSLGYVMPDSSDFPHNRIDGLYGQYQVQPPVGKFNQPDGPVKPDNFIFSLLLLQNHNVKIARQIGTMRALKQTQIKMQEH